MRDIKKMLAANLKTKYAIVVLAVFLAASMIVFPIFAAVNYSYVFEPSANYAQNDERALLRIYAGGGSVNPVRAEWYDPQGKNIPACKTNGCGPIWEQKVADNGALVWRAFYFYIAGQQRDSGNYSVIVYERVIILGNYVEREMFRANFSIGQAVAPTKGPSPTPRPTATPTPKPILNLDAEFGANGIVTTDFNGRIDEGNALTIQNNNKILVVGKSLDAANDLGYFALARYNSQGSLDAGFGSNGKTAAAFTNGGWLDQARAVALQGDEKIVVVGESNWKIAMMRYNKDGSLDTGFGAGGFVTNSSGESATSVGIQQDGKIVAAGISGYKSVLVRFLSDGNLDTSFGPGGSVVIDFGGYEVGARALAIQPDGKLVVLGYARQTVDAQHDFALARFNSDGSLDTSFGSGGKILTDLIGDDFGNTLALQKDGKILAGGNNAGSWTDNFGLVRYNPDGSLDSQFGKNGIAVVEISGKKAGGNALALQEDGKILLAGYSSGDDGLSNDFALVVFNNNGSVFTNSGLNSGITTSRSGTAKAVGIQADGKVVMAGFNGADFVLMRFGVTPPKRVFLPVISK
jgi:uncharacterized delta-60 repeat protein